MMSAWFNFGDNRQLAKLFVEQIWHQLDDKFAGKVVFSKAQRAVLLEVYASQPLDVQVQRINYYSNNVMTEQLALSLPIYVENKPTSSYPDAFDLLNRWWQKIDAKPPIITRASGLCRDCKITANAMVSLLDFMHQSANFEVFLRSLPVVGIDTMKSLKQGNHLAAHCAWIKTGTLNEVSTIAGYVQGQSGRWYALALFINSDKAQKSSQVLHEALAWAANQ